MDVEWGAWEAGAAFALAGTLTDAHADRIAAAIQQEVQQTHQVDLAAAAPITDYNLTAEQLELAWDMYIGQERLKEQLKVHIAAAKKRNQPLPHVLLATGEPGFGKTEMGKLLAKTMGTGFATIVPPATKDVLTATVLSMRFGDILFIDEVHKLVDNGKKGAEFLLYLLESGQLSLQGKMVDAPKITVVAATTDKGKLPETVIDRFPIKPEFEPYTLNHLYLITAVAAMHAGYNNPLPPQPMMEAIARSCRGTPRVCKEMMMVAEDLKVTSGEWPTPERLLSFVGTTPDGMTPTHLRYLNALARQPSYQSGEKVLMTLLRETQTGLHRIERFLIDKGYVALMPSGRKLTQAGYDYLQRDAG